MAMPNGATKSYAKEFKMADTNVDGVISPQEALAFFSKSGLPKPILSGIWKKCARGGQMDTGQFDIAMDLVHHERREAKRLAEEGGAPAAPPAVSAPSGTNALVPQPAAPDPREAAAAAERELQRQRAAAAAAEQAAAAERAARLAAEQEVARQAEEARLAAEAEAEAAAAAAAAAATAHLHHTGGSPVPVMPASAPPVDDFFGGIDAGRSASGFEDAFAATPASAAALSQVIPAAAAAGHDEGFEVDFDDFGVEPVPSPAPAPFQQPPAPFDPAAGGGYAQPAELASLTATTASVEHALGDDHATPEERMRGDAPVDGTAMAFAVPYDDTLGPTSGIGVVVPLEDDNSMTARFNVVWIKEHDGGVQLPTTLDVSIEGVRAIATKENGDEICIFFSDYYHIKSWDVATQKFGLKLMEQPPRGGGSVELSFFFLTQEARMIAGAVKAQVDQLILEKQNGIGEAIVQWAVYKKLFRVILPNGRDSTVQYIKADLRLRHFSNKPVLMVLLGEGNAELPDHAEVTNGMRLELKIENQLAAQLGPHVVPKTEASGMAANVKSGGHGSASGAAAPRRAKKSGGGGMFGCCAAPANDGAPSRMGQRRPPPAGPPAGGAGGAGGGPPPND